MNFHPDSIITLVCDCVQTEKVRVVNGVMYDEDAISPV